MNEKDGLQLVCKYRKATMGFAALWILIFHEWYLILPAEHPFYFLFSFLKGIGYYGVDIFLFLSGIGLTYSIEKGSVLEFYWHRVKRVFLPFIITVTVTCVFYKWPVLTFFKLVTCYSFWFESMYVYVWFIPAIITLYICFPIYYHLFKRADNKYIFTALALLLWLMGTVSFVGKMRMDLYGFTNRIPIFLVGILAGWRTKEKTVEYNKLIWATEVVMLLAGLQFSYWIKYRGYEMLVPDSSCFMSSSLVAISLTTLLAKGMDFCVNTRCIKTLGNGITSFLGFIGMFSLELYCVQERLGVEILKKVLNFPVVVIDIALIAGNIIGGYVLYLICHILNKAIGKLGVILNKNLGK